MVVVQLTVFGIGNGVILTATWLLPVALVPSTWDNDVVRPPTPPPKDDSNPSNPSESRKPASDTDKQPKNSKDRSSKNKKDNKKSRQ